MVMMALTAADFGDSRMFAPIFEAAAGACPEVAFARVDTEAEVGQQVRAHERAAS